MERLLVQTLLSGIWCPSWLSVRTVSVFTIHQITRLGKHIAWILLPLLCWQHPTVPLFPHPPPTPTLQRASWNVWQTSALCITSDSTFVKLNSSSSRGKTALAWTCQSPSSMSWYHLCWRRGTWVYSSTMDCPAPPTSLLWPNPADLPYTTSPGSGPSSQKMQSNSWSKYCHLPPGLLQLPLGWTHRLCD